MRPRFIASLLVLAGCVLPLSAQQNTPLVESVSHEMIASALESLGVVSKAQGDNYSFGWKNRPVTLHRLGDGTRLLVKATIKGQPSLETLNRYNEKIAVTTRAVRYENLGVILEAGVDCQLGITETGVKKFLTRFGAELTHFDAFLAKEPQAEEAKPARRKVPLEVAPNSDDKELIIRFPTNDPAKWETAWKIVWDMETGKQAAAQGIKFDPKTNRVMLFTIKKAYFKPGQQAEWIQVLEDTHPQEFYVPYYFRGTRFYDLRNVGGYVALSPKEGGAASQLLSKGRNVMAELRDTGVAYKYGGRTRRGEELTLWANFQAGNYTYMVEYGFKDDGGIVMRHSPTGYNYLPHFDASHMHGSYWRIGIKLGPEGNNNQNQAFVVTLPSDPKDQGDGGKLKIDPVTKESFYDWNAEEFTRIRVSNPNYSIVPAAKDRPALPISYDLVTQQQGIARHRRNKDEKFSLHDFWITRHDSPQKTYHHLGDYFLTENGQLKPNLLPLNKDNVVLWHSSSALHTPRAEDGIVGGNSSNNGQAIVYWTTFELRPRNLFLRTPIYR